MFTKGGYCFLYDIIEGLLLYKEKISSNTLILGAPCLNIWGIIVVSKSGELI